MLIKQPQVNIVFRDVVLATGEKARAYFAVIISEGVQEVRFLGVKPIPTEATTAAAEEVLLLETSKTSVFGDLLIPSFFETISPFYTLDFLTSQLARAPSAK